MAARPATAAPILLVLAFGVLCALIVAFVPHTDQPPDSIDSARIRAACEQYASLDLSGFAAICKDAGYQQVAP